MVDIWCVTSCLIYVLFPLQLLRQFELLEGMKLDV